MTLSDAILILIELAHEHPAGMTGEQMTAVDTLEAFGALLRGEQEEGWACAQCGQKFATKVARDEHSRRAPAPPPCAHAYRLSRHCGAQVCIDCDDHKGLERCYCGWSKTAPGRGRQELVEMGETIDPD